MIFCNGVKGCTGSVMGYQVARALQEEVVNYFKSCNWPGMHPWCFLTVIHTERPYKRALLS